ncbi:MAG: hypothetical protein H0W72_11820 [Planctomycetes bacterium]|nr:hypothetical protein [Planctomycetota bacterium]
MASRRPHIDLPWDAASDQPRRIGNRGLRRLIHRLSWREYLATAVATAWVAPLAAARLAAIPQAPINPTVAPADFIGLAVSDDVHPDATVDMVHELGVRRLLVRAPVWRRADFPAIRRFVDRFPGRDVVVAICQDRGSIADPRRWRADLEAIIAAFAPRVRSFIIGQAPNRAKWGCFSLADYFPLIEAADEVRRGHPGIEIAGPSLIDFEPLPMLRSLINLRRFRVDAVAAALYVDRRGAPSNRQYGWFDLRRKIALQWALAALSPRVRPRGRPRLWLTEANWPLAGTGVSAPTSAKECVSEEAYADYLRAYYQQAYATGLVERVYWWQLIAAGYGLVDPRGGGLRKRPGYEVMRKLISGEIPLSRRQSGISGRIEDRSGSPEVRKSGSP